jgi:flagellar assembly protein FliH
MSFEAWRPRGVAHRANPVGSSLARVFAPGEELAAAQPMPWRDAGAARGGAAYAAGGSGPETPPDCAAQIARMQQQCEQRVREAHAAGLREGETLARAQAAGEARPLLERLAQSLAELAQIRARLRKQAEGDTVKLSLAIAKRVLRREVGLDPDALRGLVMAALEKLEAQEICRVRVSAAQSAALSAILRDAQPHARIEVVADGSLAPGGVVFETNQGNLDASVDSQLREIERGLADRLGKR